MTNRIDRRRIFIFLGFAFGIAWLGGLAVFLTGGIVNSPELIPGSGITLALALMAVVYMGAPAIANVLTRVITREGWSNTWLRPRIKRGWRYWLIAWFLPGVLVLAGTALFFLLFPQHFSTDTLMQMPGVSADNMWLVAAAYIGGIMLFVPLANGLFTFGEEFGWRAYLLQKLLPLGGRTANLLLGVIWGVWHWPAIAMGHNYGFDYFGAPWTGMLAMVWMTFTLGTLMTWITLRSGSVWPAVIAHAALNGIAGVALLVSTGQPNTLLGPSLAGVVGGLWVAVVAIALHLHPRALEPQPEDLEARSGPLGVEPQPAD